jgi:hypothetical protein
MNYFSKKKLKVLFWEKKAFFWKKKHFFGKKIIFKAYLFI